MVPKHGNEIHLPSGTQNHTLCRKPLSEMKNIEKFQATATAVLAKPPSHQNHKTP
jgi:hypothetical protein